MVVMKGIDLTVRRHGGIPCSVRAPCERRGALLGVKAQLWLFRCLRRSIKRYLQVSLMGGSSVVEHRADNAVVEGSIPSPPIVC